MCFSTEGKLLIFTGNYSDLEVHTFSVPLNFMNTRNKSLMPYLSTWSDMFCSICKYWAGGDGK